MGRLTTWASAASDLLLGDRTERTAVATRPPSDLAERISQATLGLSPLWLASYDMKLGWKLCEILWTCHFVLSWEWLWKISHQRQCFIGRSASPRGRHFRVVWRKRRTSQYQAVVSVPIQSLFQHVPPFFQVVRCYVRLDCSRGNWAAVHPVGFYQMECLDSQQSGRYCFDGWNEGSLLREWINLGFLWERKLPINC